MKKTVSFCKSFIFFFMFQFLFVSCFVSGSDSDILFSGEALLAQNKASVHGLIKNPLKENKIHYAFTENQKKEIADFLSKNERASLSVLLTIPSPKKELDLNGKSFTFALLPDSVFSSGVKGNLQSFFQSGINEKIQVSISFDKKSLPTGFYLQSDLPLALQSISLTSAKLGFSKDEVPLFAFGPDGGEIDFSFTNADFSSSKKLFGENNSKLQLTFIPSEDIGILEKQKSGWISPTPGVSFTLTKTYTVAGTGDAHNPADTLQFEVSDVAITESSNNSRTGYAVTIADVTVAEDAEEAVITIQLPEYDYPGVYSYTIKEKDTNKAGVTYLADTLYLKVTVITDTADAGNLKIAGIAVHKAAADGTKIDEFENTYTAGTLKVTKTVTGNMGDWTKDFTFTVTFTAGTSGTEQDVVNGIIAATFTGKDGNTQTTPVQNITVDKWSEGKATSTFTLKHGDSVMFENIPSGVSYVVTETADKDYVTTKTGDSDTITDSDKVAAFTNNRELTPDTGITLETLPYVLLMVLAAMGLVVLKLRKREDY